jgi:predicted nucleic acid-binding protein
VIVIADTSPVNYLVLIQEADLLPRLFGQVLVPPAVWEELNDPDTPTPVRAWIAKPPSWLQVHPLQTLPDPDLNYLDHGEREAIALAEQLHAAQILVDEL